MVGPVREGDTALPAGISGQPRRNRYEIRSLSPIDCCAISRDGARRFRDHPIRSAGVDNPSLEPVRRGRTLV